jgi:hypothetical protein
LALLPVHAVGDGEKQRREARGIDGHEDGNEGVEKTIETRHLMLPLKPKLAWSDAGRQRAVRIDAGEDRGSFHKTRRIFHQHLGQYGISN